MRAARSWGALLSLLATGCDGPGGTAPDGTRLGRSAEALTLITSTPAAGVTAVSPRVEPTLVFSEPMNPSSVEAALSLSPAVACHFAWNADLTEVRCRHLADLEASTPYVASITATARSASGSALGQIITTTFTTGPAATARVLSASTGSARNAPIDIAFSAPMDHASTEAAVRFPHDRGMTGAFTWSADSTQLTFTPAQRWADWVPDPWSELAVDATAQDASHYAIASAFHTTFGVDREGTTSIALTGCPFTIGTVAGSTTSIALQAAMPRITRMAPQGAILTVTVTNLHEAENGPLLLDGAAPIARIPTSDPATMQLRWDVSTKVLADVASSAGTESWQLAYQKPWSAGLTTATRGSACTLAARAPR